jgi:hypothetical protein
MARIPMTLYKVYTQSNSEIVNDLNILNKPSPSNYLINITADELNTKSTPDNLLIDITPENFPTGLVPVEVSSKGVLTTKLIEDYNKRFFIGIGNQVFYVRSQTDTDIEQQQFQNSIKEIFSFYINPIRVTPSYKKIFNEIRTRGGWEVQHWGNNLDEIRVECRTGGMNYRSAIKSDENALFKSESIMNSYAWKKVVDLRSIYDNNHKLRNQKVKSLLGLTYYDAFYVGYFADFTGPVAEEDRPYIMNFSFTFKSQQTIYLNSKNNILKINNDN